MARKKHTQQSKSEEHAEVVVAAEAAEQARAEAAPTGRLQRLLRTAEDLAKSRLGGTRAELLVDGLPARIEKLVDAALDRVGLVRKSKLEGQQGSAVGGVEAQPAE